MFTRVSAVCLIIFLFGFLDSTAQSIASEKCREYAKQYKQPDILFPSQRYQSPCNSRTFSGDRLAKPGEFPYMAALQYINQTGAIRFACSAALISENYLLAPAYCTLTIYGSPISAKLGIFSTLDDGLGPYGQELNVLQLKPHPDYSRENHNNVLALIRLEKNVTFSKFVHPICLHAQNVTSGEVMASGWNFLRKAKDQSEKKYEGQMLKSMYSVYGQDECRHIYKKYKTVPIPDEQFCVGLRQHNCSLDPTGTIQIPNEEVACMDSLVGLNHYGPVPCLRDGIPDVYTRISPYIRWIESVVWE